MRTRLIQTIASFTILSGVAPSAMAADSSVRSFPPDLNKYQRPAIAQDQVPQRLAPSAATTILVVDAVVNNTDPNLKNTDTFNDGEVSIAINPNDPNRIVMTAFSGSWGATAPLWFSTNGGNLWTKRFTINPPPGVPGVLGCPCDQTIDFTKTNALAGTFLTAGLGATNIYSAESFNLLSLTGAFNYFQSPPGVAQATNHLNGINNEDQPWLLVGSRPILPGEPIGSNEKVYVGYDDFNTAPDMRVAVASPTDPLIFTIDRRSGFSTGFVNPGHRLATDPRSGAVYSLFQRRIAPGAGASQNINYMLNRSLDGGQTWTLNGSPTGIVVANADSTQPQPKFCKVNALLGGADHAAVDPVNGDVIYVYGNRDPITTNNRLAMRRLTANGVGGLTIGPQLFVTGQVQAAIPSVAITTDHTIGVFYYTCDGFSGTGFPIITAHFAVSMDGGANFTDNTLETFLSPAKDNGDPRQRVLGDYMQVKALGKTFFGGFTGNGVPFGRPFANNDPIFYKVSIQ